MASAVLVTEAPLERPGGSWQKSLLKGFFYQELNSGPGHVSEFIVFLSLRGKLLCCLATP